MPLSLDLLYAKSAFLFTQQYAFLPLCFRLSADNAQMWKMEETYERLAYWGATGIALSDTASFQGEKKVLRAWKKKDLQR